MARRILGEGNDLTLTLRKVYAGALYFDKGATADDLRESFETLEDLVRTARRVLGGAHPFTVEVERYLRDVRAALRDAPAYNRQNGGQGV